MIIKRAAKAIITDDQGAICFSYVMIFRQLLSLDIGDCLEGP